MTVTDVARSGFERAVRPLAARLGARVPRGVPRRHDRVEPGGRDRAVARSAHPEGGRLLWRDAQRVSRAGRGRADARVLGRAPHPAEAGPGHLHGDRHGHADGRRRPRSFRLHSRAWFRAALDVLARQRLRLRLGRTVRRATSAATDRPTATTQQLEALNALYFQDALNHRLTISSLVYAPPITNGMGDFTTFDTLYGPFLDGTALTRHEQAAGREDHVHRVHRRPGRRELRRVGGALQEPRAGSTASSTTRATSRRTGASGPTSPRAPPSFTRATRAFARSRRPASRRRR